VAKLETYKRKRDPKTTPEPFGGRGDGKRLSFVIQRHDARRLHYDFRLERDGVLLSWAVPKGVPMRPGEQHLAVHVEDHPLEYGTFEGEIPKGNYGAGTVEIWDRGTYELLEEKRNGGLTVRLHGERLDGVWSLVPAHLSGDEKNWLIVRKKTDEGAAAAPDREYEPMKAVSAEDVPKGDGWLFEVKWDGYRALAYVRGGECTLRSRNDNDLTERFPQVARAIAAAARTPNCVLDGEVCALDDEGRPSFSAMQQGRSTLVYYAFDVLEADGDELCALPLVERHERLRELLAPSNVLRISDTFEDGEALLEAARAQRLEGIMAKRADSRYQPGRRSREWLKIKPTGRQEFVVVGYTKGQGRRSNTLGSLVLAVHEADGLRWVGNVGTGFSESEIKRLLSLLRPLERPTPPLKEVPKMPRIRKGDVTWVEPKLVAEVAFVEWTHDLHLRAPSYQGLRDDKEADEVVAENPAPIEPELRRGKRLLKLSNLDKPFWPEEGITKGDLLRYYRAIAPVILPHLKDRPFTMKRYPDGWNGPFFFQKDAPKHMPDWIPTFRAMATTRDRPPQKRMINFPLVNDELALLWMVNMGCIDMNTWYSRIDHPDRPDWVLFDLDPSDDVGFAETIEVALLIKQALDSLGLVSFPKTSGSEGIHILVPVERRVTYGDSREFAEIVANAIASSHPGLATTEWSKRKRRGVLIDSNQNGEGKTIASAYSVRPKAGAPVSTPLRWNEVNDKLDPSVYTMEVALDRVRESGDLFEGVLTTKQSLAKALKQLR
jgi:bifunctional non-homologous end joining protein LigD